MTVTQKFLQTVRTLFAGALLVGFAAGLAATDTPPKSALLSTDIQKRSLLTTDGTLYQVSAGTVGALGITDPDLDIDSYVVAWSSVAQDGTREQGVLQSSLSANPKTNLDLTFDELTGSLVILYREDAAILNQIQLAVLQSGQWSFAGLLPHIGFPQALNPRMLLSHQTVTTTDDKGKRTSRNRSTLSVIWWEEAQYAQARYAPIFLDEEISSDSLKIYDLPVLVGGGGATEYGSIAAASYVYPALQLEGPSGAFLASFADLHARKHYVVRIDFPTNLGNPSDPKNPIFERRRIPVVGIVASGPLAFENPTMLMPESAPVGTIIGSSYNPTLYWQDGSTMRYLRFDGKAWSDTLSIPLGKDLTFEKALRLLEGMAARN